MSKKLPLILLAAYLVLFIVCAITPYERSVWFAENLPIMLLVGFIAWVQRHHSFSNLAYVMMAFLVMLHTIGGHYTFERVPFGFVTDLFGFERNHYDRVAHFTVGFYAYPIAEVLLAKKWVSNKWVLLLFPLFAIMSVAGAYELLEWQYALTADEAAGIAVLGSQGDIWDAQKDILADTLGAIFALVVFYITERSELSSMKG